MMDIVLIPEMEFSGSTESPEAVGHAMITAQNRPNTEKKVSVEFHALERK